MNFKEGHILSRMSSTTPQSVENTNEHVYWEKMSRGQLPPTVAREFSAGGSIMVNKTLPNGGWVRYEDTRDAKRALARARNRHHRHQRRERKAAGSVVGGMPQPEDEQ